MSTMDNCMLLYSREDVETWDEAQRWRDAPGTYMDHGRKEAMVLIQERGLDGRQWSRSRLVGRWCTSLVRMRALLPQ